MRGDDIVARSARLQRGRNPPPPAVPHLRAATDRRRGMQPGALRDRWTGVHLARRVGLFLSLTPCCSFRGLVGGLFFEGVVGRTVYCVGKVARGKEAEKGAERAGKIRVSC